MDKYEYKQLSERMIELMQNEEYGEAKEIADSIDWRRVRNAMMLANVSDIYEKTGEYQKSYDILQIAYHRAEGSRKVLYRLSSLALKTGNVDEAIDFYDEFVHAPTNGGFPIINDNFSAGITSFQSILNAFPSVIFTYVFKGRKSSLNPYTIFFVSSNI